MKASDIDMQDLALIYDDEYGPDYVAGIMASEFPALDTMLLSSDNVLKIGAVCSDPLSRVINQTLRFK